MHLSWIICGFACFPLLPINRLKSGGFMPLNIPEDYDESAAPECQGIEEAGGNQ